MDKVPKEKEKTKKKATYVSKTKPSKKEVEVSVILVKPNSLIVSLNGFNTSIPKGKFTDVSIGDIIKIKI